MVVGKEVIMNDNHSYKGSRIEKSIRGYPGIYKIWVWDGDRQRYIDPRSVSGSGQQPFRAKKRVKALGRWIQVSESFDSVEEARVWRQASNAVIQQRKSAAYTILDLIDDWREWIKQRQAESTFDLYGQNIPHLKFLFDVPVEELTAEDIDTWIKHLVHPSYPKRITRVSFEREVKTLRVLLNWYREYKNPRYLIPYLKRHVRDSVFRKKPTEIERALPWEEYERFLERLRTHQKPIYYYLAALQGMTGLRIGEACGLYWEFVDLERGAARICQVVWWRRPRKDPVLRSGTKTGETRVVLLPPRLVDLLREWKGRETNGPFVFQEEGGPLRYPAVQNAYNKALRALDLKPRSTHFLRYTFAKLHADQTGNQRATQAALGHRSSKMTDHYARVTEITQKAALTDFLVGQSKPEIVEERVQ